MTERGINNDVFVRHPGNPIITAADLPYRANTVFNAGVTQFEDETLLLLRVEDRRGLSHLTVARSKDGITDWRLDSAPTFVADPDNHPEEMWGIEDPRITYVPEQQRWLITYTAYSSAGPLVALAATTDFRSFERLGPVTTPEDKDAALFPVRFEGRWALIHRPVTSSPSPAANIWLSYSPDLKHWGDHQMILPARQGGWWDANKIGLSPPPLLCDRGWLILYHGVIGGLRTPGRRRRSRLSLWLAARRRHCQALLRRGRHLPRYSHGTPGRPARLAGRAQRLTAFFNGYGISPGFPTTPLAGSITGLPSGDRTTPSSVLIPCITATE
jgi:predicted GH43/DUF377 family glycosyl hydrolase